MGTPPDPELLALRALSFLAEVPDGLVRFLSLSGAAPEELRARAEDRQFLCGILDFILGDEEMAQEFCALEALTPQSLHLARHRLSQKRPK